MNKAQQFLIRYGLHHFVTYSETNAKHAFTIRGTENPHMVRHAGHLIKEMFCEPTDIKVV